VIWGFHTNHPEITVSGLPIRSLAICPLWGFMRQLLGSAWSRIGRERNFPLRPNRWLPTLLYTQKLFHLLMEGGRAPCRHDSRGPVCAHFVVAFAEDVSILVLEDKLGRVVRSPAQWQFFEIH
jgi:hypothetical protein